MPLVLAAQILLNLPGSWCHQEAGLPPVRCVPRRLLPLLYHLKSKLGTTGKGKF